jgi:hypothetical protein
MMNGQGSPDEGARRGKAYSVNVRVKAQSSTSCSFCWFVTATCPTHQEMTESDRSMYRLHLERSHGLCSEILP